MDYVKENVDEWSEGEIKQKLMDVTPNDSAYVNTKGIHTPNELKEIVPLTRRNINRSKHYPHPIIFVDRGGVGREELIQYDIYHTISEYVYENSGCMKFFSRTEDGAVVQSEDYIVCLDHSDVKKYDKFNTYNNSEDMVLTPDEVFKKLS